MVFHSIVIITIFAVFYLLALFIFFNQNLVDRISYSCVKLFGDTLYFNHGMVALTIRFMSEICWVTGLIETFLLVQCDRVLEIRTR
jgi:uncharacterized membrane protein